MKTREEIEKEFEKEFGIYNELHKTRIKSFFLDEVLPKVLRELLPGEITNNIQFTSGYRFGIQRIKENAKEKYNINL